MKDNQSSRTYALVYMDFGDGVPYWYIRVGGLETGRFPHGLGLASKFFVKDNAEEVADEVEDYMKQVVKSLKKK
jgi:hypothetical protein